MCSRASLRGRDGIALVQGCELLRFALNELSSFSIGAQSTQIGLLLSCLVRSLSGKGLERVLCDREVVDESELGVEGLIEGVRESSSCFAICRESRGGVGLRGLGEVCA